MVIEVKPLQPLNATSPISVTVSGMVTEVKPVQPLNAASPITVTLSGIVIEVLSFMQYRSFVLSFLYKTPSSLLLFFLPASTFISLKPLQL